MRRAKLFNEMDALGAGAVLVAYLNWASYQMSQHIRSEREVHLAIALAFVVGLAYRLGRQYTKPLYEEIASRTILLLSGILALSGWGAESVALVAGANLWFVLEGARFPQRDLYAYQKLTPLLYLFLMLISPANKYEGEILRWVIGIYLMVLFVGATQRRMHGKTNPYQNVAEFVVGVITILMLPAASISLLLAPRSTTPEAQLVERVLAGTGLCLLLLIAGWYLWEYRRGARGNLPPDAGIRSPLSPAPSVAAGNAQKLPEEESTRRQVNEE
ncbi:MAG: hypothetical protein KatS3mg023_2441 [Armatimonadota bacterium]|nr:MAG: hypothetical protein KatS3mg023_2441 [Armatimonadota bacterium]